MNVSCLILYPDGGPGRWRVPAGNFRARLIAGGYTVFERSMQTSEPGEALPEPLAGEGFGPDALWLGDDTVGVRLDRVSLFGDGEIDLEDISIWKFTASPGSDLVFGSARVVVAAVVDDRPGEIVVYFLEDPEDLILTKGLPMLTNDWGTILDLFNEDREDLVGCGYISRFARVRSQAELLFARHRAQAWEKADAILAAAAIPMPA